ncbi:DUF6075 family protein [Fusibacter sp. 3D3]|uniref:DUF6075 family protein n=2 Tax=Fusibacter sp. 3D3 TaxID=1048380 RepID=UPI0008538E46|nr:DUF6075 family protein [Fusibacter sp. 3D3]GAU78644.1 hypothetical protein F3D3_3279 [Fusibacter sp. 3D3]GAU80104.1 hypothetical protein F3D3_4770 [Fusibacter sp. 3D3]
MKAPIFLSMEHLNRYENLIRKDRMSHQDAERSVLFYLISGNQDLYKKCDAIYDFKRHQIHLCLTEGSTDFSSGSTALIRLGFNLYNGYEDGETSPYHLFYRLDEPNRILAMSAINMRFSIY